MNIDNTSKLGCRPVCSYLNTSKGKFSYEELMKLPEKELKKIYISSDTGKFPIESIKSVGEQETISIILSNGYNLICTKKHKIRVLRDNKIEWIEASNLKCNEKILCSFKEDKNFFSSKKKFNNPDIWYMYGCLLYGSFYTTKKDKFACVIYIDSKDVLEKIKEILKKQNIKFLNKKNKIVFYASLFEEFIRKTNLRIDRDVSTNVSLFESDFFKNNPELTLDNIKSFLTAIIDFGVLQKINKTHRQTWKIQFYSEKLCREIQSLMFSVGIPCNLYKYNQNYDATGFIEKKDILKTSIEFANHMAIKKINTLNIKNNKIKKIIQKKIDCFEKGSLLRNVKVPIFSNDYTVDFSECLYKYCKNNNIEIDFLKKSLLDRKYFHTCFLDLFKKDNIPFDNSVIDYIYDNQCLAITIKKLPTTHIKLQCCDIIVKGNPIYINDSIINLPTDLS